MQEKRQPNITFFGVGNAGCAILDKLSESDLKDDINLVAVNGQNTNLTSCNADVKIILNEGSPRGVHNDLTVAQAREYAKSAFEDIKATIMKK